MSDEILKRLQARSDRRSFLRGSAILVASALLAPALSAQDPQSAPAQNGQASQDGKQGQTGQDGQAPAGQDAQDGKDKDEKAPAQQAKEGDGAETFMGSDGRPYRICPQCGANMYKQNRTWTCENCGYSYEE